MTSDADDLVLHMLDRQVRPQLTIDVELVSTDLAAPGHLVSCLGCGRQAMLPFAPPEGKAVLCPQCVR